MQFRYLSCSRACPDLPRLRPCATRNREYHLTIFQRTRMPVAIFRRLLCLSCGRERSQFSSGNIHSAYARLQTFSQAYSNLLVLSEVTEIIGAIGLSASNAVRLASLC